MGNSLNTTLTPGSDSDQREQVRRVAPTVAAAIVEELDDHHIAPRIAGEGGLGIVVELRGARRHALPGVGGLARLFPVLPGAQGLDHDLGVILQVLTQNALDVLARQGVPALLGARGVDGQERQGQGGREKISEHGASPALWRPAPARRGADGGLPGHSPRPAATRSRKLASSRPPTTSMSPMTKLGVPSTPIKAASARLAARTAATSSPSASAPQPGRIQPLRGAELGQGLGAVVHVRAHEQTMEGIIAVLERGGQGEARGELRVGAEPGQLDGHELEGGAAIDRGEDRGRHAAAEAALIVEELHHPGLAAAQGRDQRQALQRALEARQLGLAQRHALMPRAEEARLLGHERHDDDEQDQHHVAPVRATALAQDVHGIAAATAVLAVAVAGRGHGSLLAGSGPVADGRSPQPRVRHPQPMRPV